MDATAEGAFRILVGNIVIIIIEVKVPIKKNIIPAKHVIPDNQLPKPFFCNQIDQPQSRLDTTCRPLRKLLSSLSLEIDIPWNGNIGSLTTGTLHFEQKARSRQHQIAG